MGPVFSGSIIVSAWPRRKRAEIPNFTGGEAAAITQQGNPYIFRTSFTQATAMPKVARYIKDTLKAKTVAVIWVNNDFGKGGRDVDREGAREAQGVKVVADISTDPGQVDFSGAGAEGQAVERRRAVRLHQRGGVGARAARAAQAGLRQADRRRDDAHQPEGDRARGRRRQRRRRARRPDRRRAAARRSRRSTRSSRRSTSTSATTTAMKGYSGDVRRQGDDREDRQGRHARRSPRRCTARKISAKDYPGVLLDVTLRQQRRPRPRELLHQGRERQVGSACRRSSRPGRSSRRRAARPPLVAAAGRRSLRFAMTGIGAAASTARRAGAIIRGAARAARGGRVKTVRWGMIGCGEVARTKSGPALFRATGSRLVAVADRNLRRARRRSRASMASSGRTTTSRRSSPPTTSTSSTSRR